MLIIIIFVIFRKKNRYNLIDDDIEFEKDESEKDFYLEKYAEFENISSHNETISENNPLIENEEIYADAWLMKKSDSQDSNKYPLYQKETTVGSGSDNDIIIDDKYVSEIHLKIKNINGNYNIFDILSKNGTYLNNKKILRPRPISDWDEIKIGNTNLIFRGKRRKV